MCKPFSCIVKSDITLIVGKSIAHHSHSEMWRDAGNAQEISVNQAARVELLPPVGTSYSSDVSGWVLHLDEDRTPEWWRQNHPEIEDRVRQAAVRWQGKLLRLERWENLVDGEHLVVIAPSVTIAQQHGGYAWSNGASTLTIEQQHGGYAWSYDTSTLTIAEQHV